jgi:antitoxin (DNA-binding transcriptional repressor) of toxin-antitoxin stability system
MAAAGEIIQVTIRGEPVAWLKPGEGAAPDPPPEGK